MGVWVLSAGLLGCRRMASKSRPAAGRRQESARPVLPHKGFLSQGPSCNDGMGLTKYNGGLAKVAHTMTH